MTRRLLPVVLACLMLTGCASVAPSPATDGRTCANLAVLTQTIPTNANDRQSDAFGDSWGLLRDQFSDLGASASGKVRDIVLAMVEDWPKVADLTSNDGVQNVNENIIGIREACAEEGTPAAFATLDAPAASTPSTSPAGPIASAEKDRTTDVQAVAGADVTRAVEKSPGEFWISTTLMKPVATGGPEAQAAVSICEAVRTLGATRIKVKDASGMLFVSFGGVYDYCAEIE